MKAGYDYALLGGPARRRTRVSPALWTLVLGAILLSAAGSYYGFTANVQAELVPAEVAEAGPAVPVTPPPSRPDTATGAAAGYTGPRIPDSAIAGQQLYPAELSEVNHWVNPLAYEP